ncbi:MAG: citrate/2-methylcitrate synthase [Phycisphaerae bacterium]
MKREPTEVTELVLKAAEKARRGRTASPELALTGPIDWPVKCTVGPGLEGAIACESKVGYVNGSQGALIYRGYDIFDLCAYSTFEEASYLVLHGNLPTQRQLADFNKKLVRYRHTPKTLRLLMGFPVEEMNVMAALRLATNLMRQEFTFADQKEAKREPAKAISADEDSIPMETMPTGEPRAVYEFTKPKRRKRRKEADWAVQEGADLESCYHLIAGVGTLAAATARLRQGLMPIEPHPELSHAGNYLYMLTGRRPTPVEERIMDIALILHVDHGMNASTFATMVVASTLSDIYLSVGSGIAALNGPLHGGANEQVMRTLRGIGGPENVKAWYEKARARKQKIMGFGHRVYKSYDPRAQILGPLVKFLARKRKDVRPLLATAEALEKEVVGDLGARKGIYPNVDFYSGLLYTCLEIPEDLFTPTFAVARVSGWTARVLEYLQKNRIFRPRAIYSGPFDMTYVPIERRGAKKRSR